ncbi:MAG: hypothetical protein NUV80_01520 [Candidatus Berkelbacteria bacterium]|nr:hypothetical protein [Candidatus Berkelbacteria bacterium]MCR4307221.1 hypothetical protein [Candidatus Berkelbacteria bacterium]
MPVASDSLITLQEAEEVVSAPTGVAKQLRAPLMIILGALMIAVATLLILLILSLRGSRTGWQSILPFLDSKPTDGLQID